MKSNFILRSSGEITAYDHVMTGHSCMDTVMSLMSVLLEQPHTYITYWVHAPLGFGVDNGVPLDRRSTTGIPMSGIDLAVSAQSTHGTREQFGLTESLISASQETVLSNF